MEQKAMSPASKFSYDSFMKLTGGSIERAYQIFGGYVGQVLRNVQRHRLHKTCPDCGSRMLFSPVQANPKGYTGRWICTDEASDDPSLWCGREELVTAKFSEIVADYGERISEDEPLINTKEALSGETNNATHEMILASIYQNVPYMGNFPKAAPSWMRRLCPKCGAPMIFYRSQKNDAGVTGVFACPRGWNESEEPDDWCGYEETTKTPLEMLFKEYYERATSKRDAARELLLKQCPQCGNYLVPRPIEENDRGWKVRWICQRGFKEDDPEGLCGYEELSTETIGSFIAKVNKMIKEE